MKLMWNRNHEYLQPKNCFMNFLRTYISQSRIYPRGKKPIKYDVVCRSKSVTLDIAYNIKIDSLLCII